MSKETEEIIGELRSVINWLAEDGEPVADCTCGRGGKCGLGCPLRPENNPKPDGDKKRS